MGWSHVPHEGLACFFLPLCTYFLVPLSRLSLFSPSACLVQDALGCLDPLPLWAPRACIISAQGSDCQPLDAILRTMEARLRFAVEPKQHKGGAAGQGGRRSLPRGHYLGAEL